jgi:hypothetical protein
LSYPHTPSQMRSNRKENRTDQAPIVCHTLVIPQTFLLNHDLALSDWLEELCLYGMPRRFQDAETAYHLSQLIRHRYIVVLAIAHTPIGLRELGTPAPIPNCNQSGLLKSKDQRSAQVAPPPQKGGRSRFLSGEAPCSR